jgi:hypothetical protein
MAWSKGVDWLPVSNAKAYVKFWTKDLWYSEKYLKYVKSIKKYNLPNYDKFLRIAKKDVEVSKNGLSKAKAKLIKTLERVNG